MLELFLLLQGDFAAPAASDFLSDAKVTKESPGDGGRPSVPPLQQIWKRALLFRRGRTLAGPPIIDQRSPARQSQARKWNRTSGNFCKPMAQWPGRYSDQPLRFCAPVMTHYLPRVRPS